MCGRVRSNGCELQRDIRYSTTRSQRARLSRSGPAVLTLAAANSSNAGALMNDFVGVRKSLPRRVFDSAVHCSHLILSITVAVRTTTTRL